MLKISSQNRSVLKNADSPSKVLSALNSMITGNIADNFVTGCYAWFDLKKKKVTISSAGHEPVIKINRITGTISQIKTRGKPIGLYSDSVYSDIETKIEDGDRFIFYTDGLVEAADINGNTFIEKLLQLIYELRLLPVREFLDMIINILKQHALFKGNKIFEDDVAVIVVDVNFNKIPDNISNLSIEHGFIEKLFNKKEEKTGFPQKLKEILARKRAVFPSLISINPDENVLRAVYLMRRFNISQIPVIDNDIVMGTVSEALFIELLADTKFLWSRKISEIMKEPMPQLDENEIISEAEKLLITGSSGIIISRGNIPIGVLTRVDILDGLISNSIIQDYQI